MKTQALVIIGLVGIVVALVAAQGTSTSPEAPRTVPQNFVVDQTEGPYYTVGSPESTNLVAVGIPGKTLILSGYVFDKAGKPVAHAWLDFWQADGQGRYDNQGFKLRGHQFTDASGKYSLTTVWPGEYPGRTNHIHVKISKSLGGQVFTSQLYFPEVSANNRDGIFNRAMVVTIAKRDQDKDIAFYNFRINQ